MGRPYADELAELPRTYAAARDIDVAPFVDALRQIGPRPMVYVGSGGSYSVAVHLQQLHERRASAVARAMTPLELIDADGLGGIPVCLISANGSHPDILSALRHAAARRPVQLIVCCATPETLLARLAQGIEGAIDVELDLPRRIDV